MGNIAILGATGNFGKGLALRWARKHTIYIGSRSLEKGQQMAQDYRLELRGYGIEANLVGTSNIDAAARGDIIVLSVKFEHLIALIEGAGEQYRNKIVISPVVALKRQGSFKYAPPAAGSAALLVQEMLPASFVVSALHTVPADKLQNPGIVLEGDVPLCGDNAEAKETVADLVREMEWLNPIDAGPLEVSEMVEPLVPLILNIKRHGLKRNVSIKFI